MSLSVIVYKNRSLSEADRAVITQVDPDTGQPLIDDSTDYETFAAMEVFIGNLFGVAALRRELELGAPEMSESIRKFVLSNGTLSGVAIIEPHVSLVAAECSCLLAEGRLNLSEELRAFLANLSDLAKTALDENSPLVLI